MRILVEILKLHLTFLCVKRVPLHIELAQPECGEFLADEVLVLLSRIHIGVINRCHINGLKFVLRVPFNVVLLVLFELVLVLG